MVKIKKLLDKFDIKIDENFPTGILNLELEENLKDFNKGYKHNGIILLNGEYIKKETDYQRTYNIRITINIPTDINYELVSKLEEFVEKNDKNIWESQEEVAYCIELLNENCVEYYLSSEGIPSAYIGYNILGGINSISWEPMT